MKAMIQNILFSMKVGSSSRCHKFKSGMVDMPWDLWGFLWGKLSLEWLSLLLVFLSVYVITVKVLTRRFDLLLYKISLLWYLNLYLQEWLVFAVLQYCNLRFFSISALFHKIAVARKLCVKKCWFHLKLPSVHLWMRFKPWPSCQLC